MPLEGEYEPSPSEWVRTQVEKFEDSGGTEANTLQEVPIVVVTMRGAKSGKLRKVPVMRVEHDGAYAMIASKGGAPEHPTWYHNLVTNPGVELQDGGQSWDMTAAQVSGDERAQWWDRSVKVWPAYEEYQSKTDREIPVFVLTPVTD